MLLENEDFREAYLVLHFTLVKCQFHFLLPLTASSSHHSLQINICGIQTRQWMPPLWEYWSCEGLKASHLSRDKHDQREYYLKCYLVISTWSGLYWVLLNWGYADCHQTLDTFAIRWLYKELSESTDFLFTRRGEELIAFSQILSSFISWCLKNTQCVLMPHLTSLSQSFN